MNCEIVILDGGRVELSIEFRYKDARASYAEFAAGLDRNGDGKITRTELDLRFVELVDPMLLAMTMNIDGKPAAMQADPDRFELADLNNPDAKLGAEAMPTNSWRIHYRFIFTSTPAAKLGPGEHKTEFFFNGTQSVIHKPEKQMLPIDARNGRKPIENAKWDQATGGFPRVTFTWAIEGKGEALPPANVPLPSNESMPANNAPAASNAITEPTSTPLESTGPRGFGEVPAWLTFASGLALALYGLISGARRLASKPRGQLGAAAMLLLCGGAIMLGALMRLGYIGTL
jgi:hypothetical protein